MGKGNDICGCAARSWAKCIGGGQIVLNLAGFIFSSFALAEILHLGPDDFEKGKKDILFSKSQPEETRNVTYSGCITILLITLCVFSLGVLFGRLLVKGTVENKTVYLRWWIAYAVTFTCWSVFYTISNSNILKMITFFASSIMYGFGVFVVLLLIQEIEEYINLQIVVEGKGGAKSTSKTVLLPARHQVGQPPTYQCTLVVENV